MRPTIDEWALGIAAAVSERGDCTRSQVGAVAVDAGGTIVGADHNGAPTGEPGCLTDGACPRATSGVEPGSSYDTGPGACIALHAEQRLIMRANWGDLLGSTLYVTREPCGGCDKMIRGAGITRVVWPMEPEDIVEIRTHEGQLPHRVKGRWGEKA